MAVDLLGIIQNMFMDKYSRTDINGQFASYFNRIIGVSNKENYDNILSTLNKKCYENSNVSLIFDGEIPLNGEMELIEYIYNELNSMNIFNIVNEEIVIFDDLAINTAFLEALQYVIELSVKNENFFNDSVRNNFITKLIVWAYSWIKNLDYKNSINPKCIYYGKINKHEIYFLIMLYKMGFDVLYLNPLKEGHWTEVDTDNLSKCYVENSITDLESFNIKAHRGHEIEVIETVAKQIEKSIHEELFSNTGMYKLWQFRKGFTKSVLLDTILEDIYIYWNEPAKLRPGFKVEDMVVTVPSIFYKIDGQYCSIAENQKILKHCLNAPNTLFFNGGNISRDISVSNDMFELMFCQLSDGTFDVEEIKKSRVYTLGKYNEELQDLLLNKFNQFIKENKILKMSFDKKLSLKLLALILYLNESIIRIIDNFDFVFSIPKIVIYLNGEDTINEWMVILLCYLHNIGIDIVIFNPSGSFNINKYIKENKIVINRLEEIRYDCKFDEIINYKQSFFSRIMNK